jgi:hypothetical protein
MKPPFQLVIDNLSHDVGKVLGQLSELDARGDLIGLAFVAMLKQRKYYVNVAGEAYRNPTFARGCVNALDDELGLRARGQSNNL